MSELEKIIAQHRDEFDSELPLDGDFGRFLAKMEKKSPRRRLPVWSVAAAVTLLVGLGLAWEFFTPERQMVRVYQRYCHQVADITADLQMSVNVSEIETLNNIIENISNENIPLMSLLPDEMRASERLAIIKGYYQDKLNGILELKAIVKNR